MKKNINDHTTTGFKLLTKNTKKADVSMQNTSTFIKQSVNHNKQSIQQPLTSRTRILSTKKTESISKEKNEPKQKQPLKKPSTSTSSTDRVANKPRTVSSTSRNTTLSPSRIASITTKNNNNLNQSQIVQTPTPKQTARKTMFTSPSKQKQINNSVILSKIKPSYEKGKILPFKKESPTLHLNKNDTNTISTISIQSRGSRQEKSLSVHKSITTNKMESLQIRSKTPLNKNVQSDALYCLVRPIFKESKYYQSSLIHWHFEQINKRQSPYKIYFELEYSSDQLKAYFQELFQEHFLQTYNCLQYCKKFTKSIGKQPNKIQYLQSNEKYQKTIVFDLDETLIHCNDCTNDPTDHTIMVNLPNEGPVETRINIRPYCQQMLKLLSNHYELMIFTASYKYYADKVLELIDPDRTIFQYRFYRDSCVEVEEGLFVKDLRVIGNRQIENILIVDNASYSYCHQLDHGIPIVPFYDNKYDKELLFLTDYLLSIEKSPQWTYQNKIHFRSYLYQQCHLPEECLRELFKTHDKY